MPETVDRGEFDRHARLHRSELKALCYRMTGSLADAEDVVQDSLVRAWAAYGAFEGRSSVRTWLHSIAVRSCLTAVESRKRRAVPSDLSSANDPAPRPVTDETLWLEPCAADVWQEAGDLPDARVSARESVGVAFLSALQVLPPQQRAAIILRDVLGWSAEETAGILDTTVAAANSALQRARATLEERRSASGDIGPMDSARPAVQALLARYLRAWEQGDPAALTALLREDALLTMPPMPAWYQGRDAVVRALGGIFQQMGPFRALALEVCGGAGVALYARSPDGRFRPLAIQALATGPEGLLTRLDSFLDARCFPAFSLAPEL